MPVNLDGIGQQIRAAAVVGLNEGAKVVEAAAKGHAPVGTGELQQAITSIPASGGDGKYTAYVVSPTRYAVYMEYGTGTHKAHPYLRPALHESQEAVTNLIRSAIARALKGKPLKAEVDL